MSTQAALYHLCRIAQRISLDGDESICMESDDSFGWDWSGNGNAPTYLVMLPKTINYMKSIPDSYMKSIPDSYKPDYSRALVLHLNFDPFTVPDNKFSY